MQFIISEPPQRNFYVNVACISACAECSLHCVGRLWGCARAGTP